MFFLINKLKLIKFQLPHLYQIFIIFHTKDSNFIDKSIRITTEKTKHIFYFQQKKMYNTHAINQFSIGKFQNIQT